MDDRLPTPETRYRRSGKAIIRSYTVPGDMTGQRPDRTAGRGPAPAAATRRAGIGGAGVSRWVVRAGSGGGGVLPGLQCRGRDRMVAGRRIMNLKLLIGECALHNFR